MKVTPDRDSPIIPKATKYHGDELLALKNVLLFAFLPVINEINSRILKYPTISSNIYNGFIGITILFANTNIYVLDYRLYKIIERLKS